MNQLSPQTQALIRSLLKLIGAAAAAHGLTKVSEAFSLEPVIELVLGIASAVAGAVLSHQKAAQIPVVAVPTGNVTISGNTEYIVKQANATVTAKDPTPKNITVAAPETVQTSPELPKAA